MTFEKAVRKVVSERGTSVMGEDCFFGLLDDYGAFGGNSAARTIMRALVEKGCLRRMCTNWNVGARDSIRCLSEEGGFSREKVYEVLASLSKASGRDISSLNPIFVRRAPLISGKTALSGKGMNPKYILAGVIVVLSLTVLFLLTRAMGLNIEWQPVRKVSAVKTGISATYLSVPEEYAVQYQSGRASLDITTDGIGVTAETDANWCRASVTRRNTLKLRWDRNPRLEGRRCTATVRCGSMKRSIIISQGYNESRSHAGISDVRFDTEAVHSGERCLDAYYTVDVEGFCEKEVYAVVTYHIMSGMFSSRPMRSVDERFSYEGKCASRTQLAGRGEYRVSTSIPFKCLERSSSRFLYLSAKVSLYCEDENGTRKIASTRNRRYHYPEDYDILVPEARVRRMKVRYNSTIEGKKSMVVRTRFQINGMEGKEAYLAIVVMDSNHRPVPAHGQYSFFGVLAASRRLTCTFPRAYWEGLEIAIPYVEILEGLSHEGECLVKAVVTDIDGKVLAESKEQRICIRN